MNNPSEKETIESTEKVAGDACGEQEAGAVKERIEEILTGINDDFVMYDHEWRYVYVNDKAAQTLGYPKEQLIGRRIWDLFPEAVGNLFYQKVQQAMAEKQAIAFEHYYEPFDRWFENRAYPISDGLLLFSTDITERKQAEEALRATEQRFTRFMQYLPGLAWIKDIEGRYVYANDAAVKAFRKPREELYGKTDDEVFPPETTAQFKNNDRQVLESETGIMTVETLEQEDGVVHHSLVSKFPIPGSDGKVSMIGGVAIDITDRKRAEEELQRKHEAFVGLIQSSPIPIMLLGLDGTVKMWNPAAVSLFGWNEEEVLGRVLPAVTEDEREEFLRDLESVRQGERIIGKEIRRRKKGNIPIEIKLWTVAVRDAEGETNCLSFVDDITERKRAEQALRESEERFSKAFNTSPHLMTISTLEDGRYLDVNEAVTRTTGYTREELIGRTSTEMNIFADPEGRMKLTGAFQNGSVRDLEIRFRAKDGSILVVLLSAEIMTLNGRQCILTTSNDITERKRAEQILRDSEERERARAEELEALMDAVPAAVWIAHDPDSRLITGSHAAHEMLRLPAGANLSKTPDDGNQPDHFKVFKDDVELAPHELPVQLAARGTEVRDFEEEIVFNDGARLHLYGNAVPLYDREGKVRGSIGAFLDITERKRIEEALKNADRRKDEFLAMLAHELRNPLAPIRNSARLLQRLGPPDSQLQWAREVIERQVEHLARLVDDLLDVSRITQGKIVLQKERVELMTVIARAIETSRPLIENRKHQLNVSLPQEPVRVEGDVTRLAQVVSNLLNNAAKYTEEGGQIRLTAEQQNGYVILRVRDTGIGIPADFLPHVFDLFTQSERSLDRSQGGLGIGLTLVRSIVEMHGGKVEAFSDGSGRGSEFVVRLPLLAEPPHVAEHASPESGEATGPARYRILVVDDNLDSAESLSLLLELNGHEVQMAHDGPATLELAQSFQPQVILLDIGLPGMDGYEVARRIRGGLQKQPVILIALTGYGQAEDREQSRKVGFDYHLTKPVDPDLLNTLIISLVGDGMESSKEI